MPKISALTSASSASATDELAIVQSSTTKRIQRQNLGVGVDELDVTNRASGTFQVTDFNASGTATVNGLKITTETVASLADDGTHAFAFGPGAGGGGHFEIWCESAVGGTLGRQNQVIFHSDGSDQVNIGGGANYDFGGTSNNDVDGKVNVWATGGVINIKNRLGGTATFTLVYFSAN